MRKEVVDRFQQKFDELNSVVVEIESAENGKQANEIFFDTLIDAYIEGYTAAGYILGADYREFDEAKLESALEKSYDGVSIQDRMQQHYDEGSYDDIQNLVESEYHRVYTQAQMDRAKTEGARRKKWVSVKDDKVRETHRYLDGVEIDINAEFVTFDGDSAKTPGGFSKAQNNARCRCILDFIM